VNAVAVRAASPLDLLHPSGSAYRVLVLGDRCPPALVPPAATLTSADVDLALIAPSRTELRQRGWLARAAGEAAGALSADGVVYAVLPRGRRGSARRRLRAAGLVLGVPLAHLPGGSAPRYLVPLDASVWRHAFTGTIGAQPLVRRALVAMRALPFGEALLTATLPTVGTVARPPGAAALAAWVSELGEQTRPAARHVLATSWRWPQGPIVLYCFAEAEAEPWGIVKVGPDSAREAKQLQRLGESARSAGAGVPRLLAAGDVAGRLALAETVLDGSPAAEALARSPARFEEVAGAVADWLARWQRETAQPTRVTVSLLEQELLNPLAELEAELPDALSYRDWLAARCAAVAGREIELVATHNDLTMWNVLLDRRGALGVLDWAEAREAGLPLVDFFYAVVDAAAACDGYRSRLDALRGCFEPGGARAGTTAALRERLRASLDVDPEAAELGFHACWLQHACNERRVRGGEDFLEIARWLARRAAQAP
jgi:hypothetical protein